MKKFKSFVEDENLKDFEEDLIGEAPPNTADAMKRYKAGKAGFTDKAHLKAKGLILVLMVQKGNQTNTNRKRKNENF